MLIVRFLGGILGLISGVAVGSFSKTLAFLVGLVVFGIQVRLCFL